MEQYYTNERNVQIVIGLLKAHGIKRIVASPGSTNVTFVASVQQDPWFEIYSCVDERSAAYMACGIALETGEPCVLSCTGATASRNYFSALTEAYYRKLPILAITSTQESSKNGHLIPQVINRTQAPIDTIKMSVHLQTIKDTDDEFDCTIKANKAILELNHHGKGPVHINLTTRYSEDYSVKELPSVRKISRFTLETKKMPQIPSANKIAIYVGTHRPWTTNLIRLVDSFCEIYNAVVFCDTVSNYRGKFYMNYSLVAAQKGINKPCSNPDFLIHIGDMSDEASKVGVPKEVWRISEDGEIADRYGRLTSVFEMTEESFFEYYTKDGRAQKSTYFKECKSEIDKINALIPELPLSQLWVARQLSNKLPLNAVLHLGILAPLRSWSYFDIDPTIEKSCNQGGFGIDGNMSTLIGASLISPDKIFYVVVGDLSFFYDMNILGNRHIGRNVRILLINNSLAAEFKLSKQSNCLPVANIDEYISAAGHNGCQSPVLVKHIAEDLGFEYLSATSKEGFSKVSGRFLSKEIMEKPIIFEVFTNESDENLALETLLNLSHDSSFAIKQALKKTMGGGAISFVKKIIK